jgi:cytochrome c553
MLGGAQLVHAADRPTGDPAAGKAQSMICSGCHGPDGNSIAPNFPKLAGLGERYLYEQLVHVRDGTRVIASMTGLLNGKSDQDLADLAAYYDGMERSGGKTSPDLLELGQKVYRAGVVERNVAACIACHGPRGGGNAPAGFPALRGQYAEYIASTLKDYQKGYEDPAGRTTDGDSKMMRSNAFGLSDLEIRAVASYISGLN